MLCTINFYSTIQWTLRGFLDYKQSGLNEPIWDVIN